MNRHWQYLKYVLRHKWFVFWACLEYGVPIWIAILHDWDKFLPSMWFSFAACFYKPDGSKQYIETPEFTANWNAHQKRNRHHWQWWMLTWDRGETELLPMTDVYRREMLADWIGAGRAIAVGNNRIWLMTDTCDWYEKNKEKMKLHPDTRLWIEAQMESIKNDARIRAIIGI